MCGICGVVRFGRQAETVIVGRMADAIAHRGPDCGAVFAGEGVALGARRLAIVDPIARSHQPMTSTNGYLHIVHNGEIYNHRELRDHLKTRGHSFRTRCDTEVILAAYAEWGERCVERFNGMWAFALWDSKAQRLFCSRDRFGIKPFYYRVHGGRFSFASEIKAFRADIDQALEANLPIVRDYLEFGNVDHTDQTFFRGVYALLPAHNLVFDTRSLRIAPYWQLQPKDPPKGDVALAFRETFLDAVRLQTRTDVPIGMSLSGGLDSSILACATRKFRRSGRPRTFTAWFNDAGMEERPYAQSVVDALDAEPHWISFSSGELVDALPSVVEAQDEPFNSCRMVTQWIVMKHARLAGRKVMLDGQGADEALAGYSHAAYHRFADLLGSGRLRTLARETASHRQISGNGLRQTLTGLARAFLPPNLENKIRARLIRADAVVHSELRQVTVPVTTDAAPFGDRLRNHLARLMTSHSLPEIVHSLDRNSMAHGIEARVPFLDHRLIELAFSLSGDQIVSQGRAKMILRRALGDLLPEAIRTRTTKLGFPTPEARFFRESLGSMAADIFASRSFRERGWSHGAASNALLRRHRGGHVNGASELWRALNLELWARQFLDGASPAAAAATQAPVLHAA